MALSYPSAWLNFRQVSPQSVSDLHFLRAVSLGKFENCPLPLRKVNLFKASCQFYNSGLSFSITWELSIFNISLIEDSIPIFQFLWEGSGLSLVSSGCLAPSYKTTCCQEVLRIITQGNCLVFYKNLIGKIIWKRIDVHVYV